MKRIIISLIIAIALIMSLGIFAYAAEGDGEGTEASAPTAEKDTAGAENETASGRFSDFVAENMAEIFSALTLIASLVTAFLYKRGLLPSVSKSLGLINQSTGAVMERVCEYSKSTDGEIARLAEKAEPILAAVNEFAVTAEKIAKENEGLSDGLANLESDTERLRAIIAMQNEMFYNVFMSAAIPQYQKDAIGEVYTQIKALAREE